MLNSRVGVQKPTSARSTVMAVFIWEMVRRTCTDAADTGVLEGGDFAI